MDSDNKSVGERIVERLTEFSSLAEAVATIEALRRQQLDLIRILDPDAECYTHAEAVEELKTARRCIEQLQQIAVVFNRDPEGSLADLDDATGELMDLLTEALPYVECELDSGAYKSRDIENRIRRAVGAMPKRSGK